MNRLFTFAAAFLAVAGPGADPGLEAMTAAVAGGAGYPDGPLWVVESAVQTLRGSTSSVAAVAVKIDGIPAAFNPADRSWQGDVTLSPGIRRLTLEAFDASDALVDAGAIDLLYIPPAQRLAGTLAGDTTLPALAGGYIIVGSLTVPAGSALRIEPGIRLYMKSGVSIRVSGALLALGAEAEPVRFTRHGAGVRWKQILLTGASESRFTHCVFEYADSEGAHQDYYNPGSRNYHEAVVLVASRATFEGCTFTKLPDESAGGEGDALAIISDDPDLPGASSAEIRNCKFLGIGQGVHERYSHVLVERCYFQGKRGDNDDVDLWGESEPPPLIRDNFFDLPVHEDRINPTRCSAIITGNIIMGGDDQAIVLRDKCSPIVMNNIIRNVPNGIAVENSCTALLVNNTIFDCGRGIRLFDLGRWDPPYNLNPGGGTATVINCIVWNCDRSISLEDSSNTTIADRGSHVTVIHSDIGGGQAGVSVSGAQSTVTWGEGNIDADPRFTNVGASDFRLLAGSPAIDAGTASQAPGIDLDGNPRPCGEGFDMGAYESGGCGEPAEVPFRRGDANGDGGMDIADVVFTLLGVFAGGPAPACLKSADVDASGALEIADAVYTLTYLFLRGNPPPGPFPDCGVEPDPQADPLPCAAYPPCG